MIKLKNINDHNNGHFLKRDGNGVKNVTCIFLENKLKHIIYERQKIKFYWFFEKSIYNFTTRTFLIFRICNFKNIKYNNELLLYILINNNYIIIKTKNIVKTLQHMSNIKY